MTATPTDWATIQQAMVDWAIAATGLVSGQVMWAGQEGPQTARPFVTLQILTGIVPTALQEYRHASQIMIDLLQITAASTQTYAVSVDTVPYTYAATVPTDTVEDIRDALLADLGALADITAAAVSTDQITLTGSSTRPHFHTTIGPAGSTLKTTTADAIRTTTYQPGLLSLRVQAHTDTISPTGHARVLISRCLASLGERTVREILSDAGVPPLQVLTQQDLTTIVGTEFESRYFADILLGGSMQTAEDTPWFQTGTITPSYT